MKQQRGELIGYNKSNNKNKRALKKLIKHPRKSTKALFYTIKMIGAS